MWILLLIGGSVIAFGVLNAMSSERQRQVERIEGELRQMEEERVRKENEVIVVGSPVVAESVKLAR